MSSNHLSWEIQLFSSEWYSMDHTPYLMVWNGYLISHGQAMGYHDNPWLESGLSLYLMTWRDKYWYQCLFLRKHLHFSCYKITSNTHHWMCRKLKYSNHYQTKLSSLTILRKILLRIINLFIFRCPIHSIGCLYKSRCLSVCM